MLYTMMQLCKETNMTYQALKFYCNEGLVPTVKRDRNNRRVFDERDVAWIGSLICLKKCGMSIQEMKEYLALCLQGEATIPKRKINKPRLLRKPRFVYLYIPFCYGRGHGTSRANTASYRWLAASQFSSVRKASI